MSDDLLLKKRVKLIRDAFQDVLIDRDGVNVAVCCVNKKCSTYGKPHKKKLCLRVDNEFYHCWVCGHRGKGLARFFKFNKPRYATKASELFEKVVKEKEEEKEAVVLPEGFTLLANLSKRADPDLKACRKYILSRGLTEAHMWYFRMGATSSGRFRRRVIIPSFDNSGFVNYFTARSIDDSSRKYLNPKVKRSEVIFNEINVDWSKELVIVEGPFDLTKSTQNSTCLLGSTLTESHELFRSIVTNMTPVTLALDPDAHVKTQKIAALLSSYDIDVKVANVSPYEDVGSMPVGAILKITEAAKTWNRNDRLRSLISTIKSGSLI